MAMSTRLLNAFDAIRSVHHANAVGDQPVNRRIRRNVKSPARDERVRTDVVELI